ncbi:Bromodomain-containing protein [Hysterangium stoloniferum]|nr:Bromodomain-containing protein [Hysterangium stoloniferum]
MKLKRELGAIDALDVSVDQPRPKRRKRGSSVASPSINEDIEMANQSDGEEETDEKDQDSVKELGMKIWNILKNAKGKDGRILSHDFMRLPSKRQYADYYDLIKRPVALEDIKQRFDTNSYSTLEAAKQDFDTCFKNAKKYNMKDSQIWRDARTLHKLATAEYKTLTGTEDDVDVIGTEGGEGSDEDGDKTKSPKSRPGRPTSLTRLIKSRLQKLSEKTDHEGRLLSEVFMELPPKKIYPIYYKTIKKLMCFDTIFKKIKRKEYPTAGDFAADVELVFTNALTFNEEHSIIWEDATTLKAYFKQLMSDLPPPYSLPQYSGTTQPGPPQNGKLKLRVPVLNNEMVVVNGSTSLKVKLPPLASASSTQGAAAQQQSGQSTRQATSAKDSRSPQVSGSQPASTQVQNTSQVTTPHLRPATYSHINTLQPQPQYQYHSQPASQPQSTSHSISPSPLPSTPASNIVFDHPLRSITLRTLPLGRTLRLDSSEGVRTWVLRLGKGELTVDIRDVRFFEVEESDEEEQDDEEATRNDDDNGEAKKGDKVNGEAKKSDEVDEEAEKGSEVNGEAKAEVIVKANGLPVNAKVPNQKEGEGVWEVTELKSGTNILEVGEKAGEIWKIVLQRIGTKG